MGGVEHRVNSRRGEEQEKINGKESEAVGRKGKTQKERGTDKSPKDKVRTPGQKEGKEKWERNLEQSGRGDRSKG